MYLYKHFDDIKIISQSDTTSENEENQSIEINSDDGTDDIEDNISVDSSIKEGNDQITIYDEDLGIDKENMMQSSPIV